MKPLFVVVALSPALLMAQAPISSGQVQVLGVTSPQAILEYTAPDNNPCTVEASESSSYTPLVNDVNPALFPGSNSDSRAGSITAGADRVFVLGRRAVDTAADNKNYSRALQANMQHYVRVTCGSTVLTGTFTTANIPLGNTYSDVPLTTIPTISSSDRTQQIIDPLTGALIKRFTLAQDSLKPDWSATNGAYMTYAGFNRMCGEQLVGPGPGFLCAFPNGGGIAGLLYYVIPSTGEVRYLGYLYPYFSPKVDSVDSKIYVTDGSGHISRLTYTGDFSEARPNTAAPFSTEVFSSLSPAELVRAYDPMFPTFGSAGTVNVSGNYAALVFTASGQDSYGSVAVLAMGNRQPIGNCGSDPLQCPHIVAASYMSTKPAARWCGFHNVQLIPGQPVMNMELHELGGNGQYGLGPYYSTLTAALAPNATTLVVSGEPMKPGGAPDAFWMAAAVGDTFYLRDGAQNERITITGKQDANHWTVARTAPNNSYAAGTTRVVAGCPGNWLAYWRFLDDPTGSDTTNTLTVNSTTWPLGGHDDWGANLRLTEGYLAVKGPVMADLAQAPNFNLTPSPLFAGVRGVAFGNTFTAHPSYHQSLASPRDQAWFLDQLPFIGDPQGFNPPGTLVSGQLWKVAMKPGIEWNRKVLPTFVVSGTKQLIDISGPGSVIGDTASDAYKYCEARKAGECRAGSVAGEVYANVPSGTGSCGTQFNVNDLCIGNQPMHGQAVVQLGLTSSTNDRFSRVLTNGLAGYRQMGYYATAKALPDASWIMFSYLSPDQLQNEIFLLKAPPYVRDQLDRSTFLPIPISIIPPENLRPASAAVEFGYAEFGPANSHYCTSRKEACLAVAATITNTEPFSYAGETYTPMPCTRTCTIPLPLVPNHVAYYTVKFYDSNGTFIGNGQSGAVTEPASQPSPNIEEEN
jgi:hypothetical protein